MKINQPWYVALGALGGAAVAVLYFFAPDRYGFYPQCFFFSLTGWLCPGCGGLRATHSLLHGDIEAAFAYNPLLVSLIPAVSGVALWLFVQRVAGRPLRWPVKPFCLWVLLGVGVVFAVVRNLPGTFFL